MTRSTTIRRLILLSGSAALGLAALAGCTFPGTGTGDASPTPGATAAPSASPSTSPTPSVALPAACRDLVSPEVYAATFGEIPVNVPAFSTLGETGVAVPTAPAEGASAQDVIKSAVRLECVWSYPQADITGLTALVSIVDPAVSTTRLDELAAAGYTCADMHGGRRCQQLSTDATYDVPVGNTAFARDDVFIQVSQANFATNDLLGSMTTKIWGS